jgi:type VI secretion system secreted protein VgrG
MSADNIVRVSIELENMGKQISPFISMMVRQGMGSHHYFEVSCPMRVFEADDEALLNATKDAIGDILKIGYTTASQSQTVYFFKGIVTDIGVSKYQGLGGDIILKGYSTTVLLDDLKMFKGFNDTSMSAIISNLTSSIPRNLLSMQVDPNNTSASEYSVLYDETIFNYLLRCARRDGEWIYFDGTQMVYGKKPSATEVRLNFGNDISDLQFSVKVLPVKFDVGVWSYQSSDTETRHFIAHAADQSINGLDNYGQFALDHSPSVFPNTGNIERSAGHMEQSYVDEYTKKLKGAQTSKMVVISGQSTNPNIKIGGVIEISGVSRADSSQTQDYGKFLITAVQHKADGSGVYQNRFEGIPHNVAYQPYEINPEMPYAKTQTAIVTDNNDPDKLGRVKVRFHWMDSNTETSWLRVSNAYATNNAGFFFIPDINDEVIVNFLANNPGTPYVVGSVYNAASKPMHEVADVAFSTSVKNKMHGIISKDGLGLVFNDHADSSNSPKVSLGDKTFRPGIVLIQQLDGGTVKILAEDSTIIMSSDKGIEVTSKQPVKVNCDNDVTIKGGSITLDAGSGAVKIKGGSISLEAQNSAEMKAANTTIHGDAEVKVSATNVTVAADAQVKVSGNAQAEVSSSGQTAVKGTIVMIN